MSEQSVQTPSEQTAADKAAAERAAEQERAECRKAASSHLDKAEACVKRAERGLSEGYILAGYHADVALALRLKAGDSRAAAIQGIEGRLAEQSSVVIKADRLIACYHAYRLLFAACAAVSTHIANVSATAQNLLNRNNPIPIRVQQLRKMKQVLQ
jgi:hypothetical protein